MVRRNENLNLPDKAAATGELGLKSVPSLSQLRSWKASPPTPWKGRKEGFAPFDARNPNMAAVISSTYDIVV